MAGVVCGAVGDVLCPKDRPSPIFTFFSCLINGIAGVWAIVVLTNSNSNGNPCNPATRTWVIIGIVNLILNVIFAIYLYIQFTHKIQSGEGASEAAYKIFMYDWGVCFYIVFLIWLVVWMVLAGNKANEFPSDPCGQMNHTLVVFLVIYLIVGFFMILLSLATECCREPRWKRERQQAFPPAPPAHHQQQPPPVVQAQPAPAQQPGLFGRLFGGSRGVAAQPPPPVVAQPQQQPVYYDRPPPVNPNFQPQHT